MRVTSVLAVAVLLAFVAACAEQAPPPPPAMQGTPQDEETLRGMPGRFAAAWNANDAAALGQLVTEDYEGVQPDGAKLTGRAGFEQMEAAGMKARQDAKLTMTLSTSTEYLNWIDAKHAVLGGTWTASGAPPGSPEKGAWIVVAEKGDDGQWRISNSLAADFVPPPPMPPSGT
jgi:uncharacterized protein (TIGR02246 family)